MPDGRQRRRDPLAQHARAVAHMNLGLALDFGGKWMTAAEKRPCAGSSPRPPTAAAPTGRTAPVRFRDVNWVGWDLPDFLAARRDRGAGGLRPRGLRVEPRHGARLLRLGHRRPRRDLREQRQDPGQPAVHHPLHGRAGAARREPLRPSPLAQAADRPGADDLAQRHRHGQQRHAVRARSAASRCRYQLVGRTEGVSSRRAPRRLSARPGAVRAAARGRASTCASGTSPASIAEAYRGDSRHG